jgi:hypothetical protein
VTTVHPHRCADRLARVKRGNAKIVCDSAKTVVEAGKPEAGWRHQIQLQQRRRVESQNHFTRPAHNLVRGPRMNRHVLFHCAQTAGTAGSEPGLRTQPCNRIRHLRLPRRSRPDQPPDLFAGAHR